MIGTCWQQGGQRWIVVCDTANILTLRAANGKRPDRIIHPSELSQYTKVR